MWVLRYCIFAGILFFFSCSDNVKKVQFVPDRNGISEVAFSITDLNSELPSDWSKQEFLILELKASSSQRFEIGIRSNGRYLFKRYHPLAEAHVQVSIPLQFYRQQPSDGSDMAATWNRPRDAGWINVEWGGFGPIENVDSIKFRMVTPIASPSLEVYSVGVAAEDPGDKFIDPEKLIDKYGQLKTIRWEGKITSDEQLHEIWEKEEKTLTPGNFDYDQWGGYQNSQAKATGYFRVEKINDKWWFIDPDGHYFLSTGSNMISPFQGTRVTRRESIFDTIPGKARAGFFGGSDVYTDFLANNIKNRYGDEMWQEEWEKNTKRRLNAWGFNTGMKSMEMPYITFVRGTKIREGYMGLPDVYGENYEKELEEAIAKQAEDFKNDQLLIGYYIGNEPAWPNRESLCVDIILEGKETGTQKALKKYLGKNGDTPENRVKFCKKAFSDFLDMVIRNVKKYDPNHLVLGIRFGGTPPDYLIEMARKFDVYSLNVYAYRPNPAYLDKVAKLSGLPIIIGEYHFGAPERGLASGLSQVKDQNNRGVAYIYYTENALSHQNVVGAHWFQWTDQPVTGRRDGENYNIGIVNIVDIPYKELTDAITASHERFYRIHSGIIPPSKVMPEGATDVDADY